MDGVIVIDKPKGWTSHDVVAKLRKILNIKKIGHVGTLDPFSTGVLPVCIGKATRLSNLLTKSEKSYTGEMRFGFATDTYDIDGKQVSEYRQPLLNETILREAFAQFTGEILQRPPLYSAKKLAGKPLYEYARKGIEVERGYKKVTIKKLELREFLNDRAAFEVTCSVGTYVRALAHDIGEYLGCGAHLTSLCRTRAGNLDLGLAIKIKVSEEVITDREYYQKHLIPMNKLLPEIPALVAPTRVVQMICQGRDFMLSQVKAEFDTQADTYRILDESKQLLAIAKKSGFRLHPSVVLK